MAKEWPPQSTGVFEVSGCVLCCTPDGAHVRMDARGRSQDLWIIGIPTFLYPITLKRWLREDAAGALIQTVYESTLDEFGNVVELCGVPLYVLDSHYSGYLEYAPSPLSSTGLNGYPTILADTTSITGTGVAGTSDDRVAATTVTETSVNTVGTGYCVQAGWWGGLPAKTDGGIGSSLTKEYTDEMAIAHFQSLEPWSDWQLGVSVAHARRGSRDQSYGSYPSFNYAEGEWRVTKDNAIPRKAYSCTMKVERSPMWMNEYVHYADVIVEATSNDAGVVVFEGLAPGEGYPVPNEEGYDTRVVGPPIIVAK